MSDVSSARSHPVWVRGLKHTGEFDTNENHEVAPRVGAWIETLSVAYNDMACIKSHPVWVRGLKQYSIDFAERPFSVAPRVGAWIETEQSKSSFLNRTVAPRVGAWIETTSQNPYSSPLASHPVWVRGLKPNIRRSYKCIREVAPRVGAWIETQ